MGINKHNGWNSYETWLVAVWFQNDEGLNDEMLSQAGAELEGSTGDELFTAKERAEQALAEYMLDRIRDEAYDVQCREESENVGFYSGLLHDLISSAFTRVDFYEIARHYIADHLENQRYIRENKHA